MPSSSRFATGTHVLAYLAIRGEGGAIPSERIAASVNTSPTVVRQLLMRLSAAGLTTSQLGVGGGAMLARPAESISLLEIYNAVEEIEVFAMHRTPPNPKCLVGRNISGILMSVASDAEEAVRGVLGSKTLADVASAVMESKSERLAHQ